MGFIHSITQNNSGCEDCILRRAPDKLFLLSFLCVKPKPSERVACMLSKKGELSFIFHLILFFIMCITFGKFLKRPEFNEEINTHKL